MLASLGRISGEGPVQPPDAALDVAADFGPFSAQANLTWTDERLFAGLLGQDFEIQAGDALPSVDIGAAPRALLRWVRDPVEIDRVEVDGTRTVHLSADIDRDAVIDDLGPLLAEGGVSAQTREQLRAAFRSGATEIWIAESDLLPRRITVDLALSGTVDELDLARLGLDASLELGDYGRRAEIAPPDDPQPIGLDELGSVLGG